jgi:hypothetical protein
MFEKNKLLEAILIIIVALAVLEFLAPSIVAIDATNLPQWQVDVVQTIQYFFNYAPIALFGGFAWSLFGYLRYKFDNPAIVYDINKFSTTLMWWVGIMTPISLALPTKWGLAVTGILMAIKSIVNQLQVQATKTAS